MKHVMDLNDDQWQRYQLAVSEMLAAVVRKNQAIEDFMIAKSKADAILRESQS